MLSLIKRISALLLCSALIISLFLCAACITRPVATPTPAVSPTPTVTHSPAPTVTPVPTPAPPDYDYTSFSGTPFFGYYCGDPVPESDAVDTSYFADAAFLGDSRTEGLKLYSGIRGASFFSATSITVYNIDSKADTGATKLDGTPCTLLEAFADRSFSKVYIMLGINEIGFSATSFYTAYGELIDSVRAAQPDAVIYVQAIIPVTGEKNSEGSIYNNTNIKKFNEKLKLLCVAKSVHYIDTYNSFLGSDGALPEEASWDGVHLITEYYRRWYSYLKTHTVAEVEGGGVSSVTPSAPPING